MVPSSGRHGLEVTLDVAAPATRAAFQSLAEVMKKALANLDHRGLQRRYGRRIATLERRAK